MFFSENEIGGSLRPSRSTYFCGRKKAVLFLPASETLVVILISCLFGYAVAGSCRLQGISSTLLLLRNEAKICQIWMENTDVWCMSI